MVKYIPGETALISKGVNRYYHKINKKILYSAFADRAFGRDFLRGMWHEK